MSDLERWGGSEEDTQCDVVRRKPYHRSGDVNTTQQPSNHYGIYLLSAGIDSEAFTAMYGLCSQALKLVQIIYDQISTLLQMKTLAFQSRYIQTGLRR